MASLAHPSNPLALAVLALLFERPMHPYEMAATLKQRHKGESIKIRYGSLYTVVELLVTRGWIAARETSRAGKRPERTVYALTPSGYDELRAWMQDLLRDPVREYPQFTPGLSLSPVFSTEEAVALLGNCTSLPRRPGSRRSLPSWCSGRSPLCLMSCRRSRSARNFRRCLWSRVNLPSP